MSNDDLQIWLKQLDAAAGSEPTYNNLALASRVRQAAKQKRRLRTIAAAVLLIGTGALTIVFRHAIQIEPPQKTLAATHIAPVPDAIAALGRIRREIALREATTRNLLLAERLEYVAATIADDERLATGKDAAECAASAMISQVDRGIREAGLSHQIQTTYANVVRYFPDTASANIARRRLLQMQKEG